MKKTTYFLSCLLVAAIAVSCKKDKTVTEQPFKALFADNALSDAALNDTTTNSSYYEFGFEFTATKDGKITQLGIHNPAAGTVRATLWDLSDTSVIVQKSIVVEANVPKYEDLVSAVIVTAGEKYAITMESDDWYTKYVSLSDDYTYPIKKGNINITRYGYRSALSGSPAAYPTTFPIDYLAGIADITFETEE